MKYAFADKVALCDNVLIEELGDESVLLNLDSMDYISQDDVGTRMLKLLTESDSIEDAYNILLGEYEVEPDRLKQDLMSYVEQLLEQELVEVKQ